MDALIDLLERPTAEQVYMIAGWHQWADAGEISSGLPRYLVDRLQARRIGEIHPDGFYLFQIPGTHHLLRPQIKLEDGYRLWLQVRRNEFYFWGDPAKGLVMFLGDEPHRYEQRYAEAFLDVAEELQVKRIVALGGVFGAMPYDRDREVSCVYSLPSMKDELARYALKPSDYTGGATIGVYLADRAEQRGIELLDVYAFVPSYDFGQPASQFTGIQIGKDFRAWYELMRRIVHMFGLNLDLSDLRSQSEQLTLSVGAQIDRLDKTMPQLKAREYLNGLYKNFQENPFVPLGHIWEEELGSLFGEAPATS